MPNTQWKMLLPPPSRNSVQITRTNPTSLDLDIDIVVTERLGLELVQLELSPVFRVLDLEALERIWVNHFVLSSQLPQSTLQSNKITVLVNRSSVNWKGGLKGKRGR